MQTPDRMRSDPVYDGRAVGYSDLRLAAVVLSYVSVAAFWLIVAFLFQQVGHKIIITMGVLMWVGGALASWYVPDQSATTTRRTRYFIAMYAGSLLLYRIVLTQFVGLSPNDWGRALGTYVPTPFSATAQEWIQILLIITLFSMPFAYLIWLAQLYTMHKGRGLANEVIARLQRRDTPRGPGPRQRRY